MSSQSPTSDSLFILDNQQDLHNHLANIISQGKDSLFIFSRELSPTLFNHQEMADAISRLSRYHRNAEARILIQHPQALVDCNHKLLQLSRRLPSKILLRKITTQPADDYAFVIVDDDKLWLQHKEEEYKGFANYQAKPEVKQFKYIFDELWRHSQRSPELRQLTL